MRSRLVLLAFISILFCILTSQMLFAQQQDSSKAKKQEIAWFIQDDQHGLIQTPEKELLFGEIRLDVTPRMNKLYAAIYFPQEGTLITVEHDATARIYKGKNHTLRPEKMKLSEFKATTTNVWFTRMPIVYIECTEDSPSKTKHCLRVVLREPVREWHAFTSIEPKANLLDGYYQSMPNNITRLKLKDGSWVNLKMPEQVRVPFDDFESLDRSVYHVQEHSLVVITEKGLAVFRIDGTFVRWTPVADAHQCAWINPTFKDGLFTIEATPKVGQKIIYRVDIETGHVLSPIQPN